jgi:hypothetical protein
MKIDYINKKLRAMSCEQRALSQTTGKAVFQGHHQEIILPAAFIDPVGEIAVKRHIFNRYSKDRQYYFINLPAPGPYLW